ncbi:MULTISPECIES: ribbon-helix-helix domain-containing protein [unclassified Rhizobium]|uniref:ribbon-helix-helix domain-containing protein n=1 Tax=unclassified Rhizobium TaxID=2613769 RepID=UPI001AD96CDA|nr:MULTISPECIES: type II toxin-antitoxin system ParD family antitoxin [unclassified Rhizobium]MBO9097703.1 type II toxin-antitoxin system ParD family antitoxin [Rhizobium sp. L58/93]MBO9133513.1 type II toxin-antitoxin system ParD family antitoxin [Rhizobium sp. B209b/85]MBO9167853.1 type II toxin-antitoxin system ParD family antitoxin [Rhizobium sp. L245/93]MBO9183898.1 type II toxin-antitoxin system ParD family antitoxin [Rhizobium sp. E27B/91]QXZ84138.1 type II toxin-antitoxin system ParD f
MPMVTVSISPMQVAGIRAAVDNGNYASGSEVVREALRMWDAARKRGDLCDAHHLATGLPDGAGRDDRRVADMLADFDASVAAHN